jgi:hypothetical protein
MSSDLLLTGSSASRFTSRAGRSLSGEGVTSIRYPSPFFDIAHTYLPNSTKDLLKWCRFYFLTNPLINAVCYKMAEYPVTDLLFDTEDTELKRRWTHLFRHILKFKKFQVEAGLDYNTYGNCFISIFYPFIKFLICTSCRKRVRVDRQKYTFREHRFHGTCRSCQHTGVFKVYDHYIRAVQDLRLIRWNPEYITIRHNEATGESQYYYRIPPGLANDVRMAKRHTIERTPQIFVDALRKNKQLLFSRDNIFHLKRPTIAQKDKGWGLPMILPVLKDTFYLQILRKAQEAIATEHIVPLRILFPQSASNSADVYSTLNLSNWRKKIEQEILRWRLDNNYIPTMPIPVGQQTLGGDGRALMLAQEYRVWAEHIVAGMGVPIEFVFGGMQYSGSNVSMRILENHFLDYRADHQALIRDFLMPNIAAFMGWERVPFHFRNFKMADDLQRNAFLLNLNQAGKVSDKSLLEESDFDSLVENKLIAEEQKYELENQRQSAVAQARIQGESQLALVKYQNRAMMMQQQAQGAMQPVGPNQAPGMQGMVSPEAMGQGMVAQQGMANMTGEATAGQPMEPPEQDPASAANGAMPGGMASPLNEESEFGADLVSIAKKIAARLDQMPDDQKQSHLIDLQQQQPQLYSFVLQLLQQSAGAHVPSQAQPLPEQRPPRRGPEAAAV